MNNRYTFSSVYSLRAWACFAFFLIGIPFSAISQSVVETHGLLQVSGNRIVNKNNQPTSLAGNSLFWSNAGGIADFYNAETVDHLASDWNSSIVRIAMGVRESWDSGRGYIDSPEAQKAKVKAVVEAAIANGIYVIIDWHTHEAERYEAEAAAFFGEMAELYGDHDNVIYEIYNEPIRQSWGQIKSYAEVVIAAIRAKDPDNLIIVGTPTWSQDVDIASLNPISDVNVAYTLHFYAGTHRQSLRDKAKRALDNGIALFATEWGAVNADGNGAANEAETNRWMEFFKENHISHANWSVVDKNEGASVVRPNQGVNGLINNELTATGFFVKDLIKNWSVDGGSDNQAPTVSITSPSDQDEFEEGDGITITASASDNDGTIVKVAFFSNGTKLGEDTEAPFQYSINDAQAGSYTFTVVATDDGGATQTSTKVTVEVKSIPDLGCDGTGVSIANQIEAEDYCAMNGIQTEATTDNGGGINIGWIDIGDYVDYRIEVPEAGDYQIAYRVASLYSRGEIDFRINDNSLGKQTVPNTGGWQNWETVETTVTLPSGSQTIRLFATGDTWNLNWFKLTKVTDTDPDPDPSDDCKFNTPSTSPLNISNYNSYSHAHVIGANGPNLNNVRNFTINWNPDQNGLYQFSFSTDNGIPNYYIDLRRYLVHSFGSTNPDATITGSGIPNFDGDYWVTADNGNFVMVSKTGGFTIYFSNTTDAPDCKVATDTPIISDGEEEVVAFPNPIRRGQQLTIDKIPDGANTIEVVDYRNRVLLRKSIHTSKETIDVSGLRTGLYVIVVSGSQGRTIIRFQKQ